MSSKSAKKPVPRHVSYSSEDEASGSQSDSGPEYASLTSHSYDDDNESHTSGESLGSDSSELVSESSASDSGEEVPLPARRQATATKKKPAPPTQKKLVPKKASAPKKSTAPPAKKSSSSSSSKPQKKSSSSSSKDKKKKSSGNSKEKPAPRRREKLERKLTSEELSNHLEAYKIVRDLDAIKEWKIQDAKRYKQLRSLVQQGAAILWTERSPTGRLFQFSSTTAPKLAPNYVKKTRSENELAGYHFISMSDFEEVVTLDYYETAAHLKRAQLDEFTDEENERLVAELEGVNPADLTTEHKLYALIKSGLVASTRATYTVAGKSVVVCWPKEKKAFWLYTPEARQRLGPLILVASKKITINNMANEKKKLIERRQAIVALVQKLDQKVKKIVRKEKTVSANEDDEVVEEIEPEAETKQSLPQKKRSSAETEEAAAPPPSKKRGRDSTLAAQAEEEEEEARATKKAKKTTGLPIVTDEEVGEMETETGIASVPESEPPKKKKLPVQAKPAPAPEPAKKKKPLSLPAPKRIEVENDDDMETEQPAKPTKQRHSNSSNTTSTSSSTTTVTINGEPVNLDDPRVAGISDILEKIGKQELVVQKSTQDAKQSLDWLHQNEK